MLQSGEILQQKYDIVYRNRIASYRCRGEHDRPSRRRYLPNGDVRPKPLLSQDTPFGENFPSSCLVAAFRPQLTSSRQIDSQFKCRLSARRGFGHPELLFLLQFLSSVAHTIPVFFADARPSLYIQYSCQP